MLGSTASSPTPAPAQPAKGKGWTGSAGSAGRGHAGRADGRGDPPPRGAGGAQAPLPAPTPRQQGGVRGVRPRQAEGLRGAGSPAFGLWPLASESRRPGPLPGTCLEGREPLTRVAWHPPPAVTKPGAPVPVPARGSRLQRVSLPEWGCRQHRQGAGTRVPVLPEGCRGAGSVRGCRQG